VVKVYAARDSLEAHFLKSVLETEGIRAVVLGEILAAARGELPLTVETLPSVWVHEADRERATELAATISIPQEDVVCQPAWTCRRCGERHEGAFSECWQCGASRPVRNAMPRQ
jgi:hypothetical protein